MVKLNLDSCLICAKTNPLRKMPHNALAFPEVLFQCFQIDFSHMPAVGNLKCMLTIVDRFSKWPDVLTAVLAEMRMTPSSTTKYSPFEILMERPFPTPWVKGRAGVSSLGDMEVILDDYVISLC